MRSAQAGTVTQGAARLSLALLLGGCAAMSHSIISVEGASAEDHSAVAVVALDTRAPALLRGVDSSLLPGVQVPSTFRSYCYVLPPGEHILWASSVPYGNPLIPQHIRCYVLSASLSAGASYVLSDDQETEAVILSGTGASLSRVVGQLVDRPLMLERSCRWK
jgi:hypothetical protein